ncbi:hypothetical protein SAMN05443247_04950 [Bradyrhizobium erythrophlei]|nr:hypothetical protein SAMN05443247_04950 [Bradyrhizobium erythrophlei]
MKHLAAIKEQLPVLVAADVYFRELGRLASETARAARERRS